MTDGVMNFDYFAAGEAVGSTRIDVAPLAREWAALFPCSGCGEHVPASLLVAIMMRGYLTLANHRPPGNIHAWQRLRWGPPARRDAVVTAGLHCLAKERRGDRPWLTFGTTVTGASGERHLDGEMRFLWAA